MNEKEYPMKFVSYDGADSNGVRAEVVVQAGEGKIVRVEGLDGAGRNAQVFVKSELAQVKREIKGWVSKSDPIFDLVKEALASGAVVNYRTESQRNNSVDRSLPMEGLRETTEIAGQNTKNLFVGINGRLSDEAVTDPAEDPAPGGRIKAGQQQPAPSAPAGPAGGGAVMDVEAALRGLAAAREAGLSAGVLDAATALALMAGATPQQVVEAGFAGQDAANRPQVTARGFAVEAAPFKAYNSDQRLNLGSYQVQAAFGAERVGYRLLHAMNQKAFEDFNAAVAAGTVEDEALTSPDPVDLGVAAMIGRELMNLADRVQVGAYGGGRPDRMVLSHARARSLVFEAVEDRHPWPFGKNAEEVQAWKDAVVEEGVDRFRVLAEIGSSVSTVAVTPAAPAEQPAQEAASVKPAAVKARPIVEGEDGFVEPTPEVRARFGALATAAGYVPQPGSPLALFIRHTFGVPLIRQVNGADLDKFVGWFESKGDQAGPAFKARVEKALADLPPAEDTTPENEAPEAAAA